MESAELRTNFEHFDKDHDGHIDLAEFTLLLREGLQDDTIGDEELQLGFSVIDSDGNGTIEFGEFEVWWSDYQRG